MASTTSSIINLELRRPKEKLNILTCPTHEAYETDLCKTGHNFYAVPGQNIKPWNTNFRPVPDNYFLLPSANIPVSIDIDLVLAQNRFGQYQLLYDYANQLHIPLITLEHTLPVPGWDRRTKQEMINMSGNINTFICDYSVEQWGYSFNDPTVRVVNHCVDTNVFFPINIERKNSILTVANDFINRDYCLNYKQFRRVTHGFPVTIVGETPGLSKAAGSLSELVHFYRTHRVYLNTAHVSPIPKSLIEAMACGCAVVSCNTAAIPEFIKHGENGFLAKDDNEMAMYLRLLTEDEELAKVFGENAYKTISEKYTLGKFVNTWNNVFEEAVYGAICSSIG